MRLFPRLLIFLVAGYLTMTRSFAHLGIPAANIFIGEAAIAAFVLAQPRATLGRWFSALAGESSYGGLAAAAALFLGYGWFEVLRGLAKGQDPLLTLEGFAFHYYPVCFFIGLWLGSAYPDLLRRTIRVAAWSNGIYGLLYIAFLSRFPLGVPGTADVPLFGQPAGSAVVILGLICLEPQLGRVWRPLLLNSFVMLALQVRAEYLGFLFGITLWSLMTRRFDRLLGGFAAIAALLVVGLVTDFRMPAPATRGGQISTREIFARVVAPFDEDLAAEYSDNAKSLAGTATWRTKWWQEIWEDVHRDSETALIGEGYGFPLADLVGYKERDLRTPHSVFFYALAYGGWIGVAIFAALEATLGITLWKAWRISGLAFGPVLWIAFCTGACFGNAFETPFGAIPFYLLVGMAAAPLWFSVRKEYAHPVGTYVLQTAGR